MSDPSEQTVFVEARARLHFGVFDLGAGRSRWFGGIGAAAPAPTLLVSARRAARLEIRGEDSGRVEGFARRIHDHFGLKSGARIDVHRVLPGHAGLGSGTQLALAVGRALLELQGVDAATPDLARALGRGERSAIGAYAFDGGGLVVEGGRRRDSTALAPLLARMRFPSEWWCVVGVPDASPGISGDTESAAFERLGSPSDAEVGRVCRIVLMELLPSLADADIAGFGKALGAVQSITGEWWAPVQGGVFTPGPTADLVEAMLGWGAAGVGQSSWGPAVYGIVDGEDLGRELAGRVRQALGPRGSVWDGPFPTSGARVWRGRALDPERRIGTRSGEVGLGSASR